jgi:biopolymer transport protein ExbD
VVVADYAELAQRISQRHDTKDKKETLALNIYGTDEVHWRYVVQAFDTAIGCGVEKVQFAVGKENSGIKLAK